MGFFSGKTKVYVSSVTVGLGGDDIYEGQYNALIGAIFQNTSIAASLINTSINGLGLKMQSVYNYARDYYYLGLPQGYNGISETGDVFMPIVPIRYLNQDLTDAAHQTTPLYTTSKKLLKKINIDIDSLAESINENPDINSIDHAFLMFGIPLQTKNNESIRYLTEYFHALAKKSRFNVYDFISMAAINSVGAQNEHSFLFNYLLGAEAPTPDVVHMVENGLNITLMYSFINTRIKTGTIGSIGTATSTTDISTPVLFIGTPPTEEQLNDPEYVPPTYEELAAEGAYTDGTFIVFRLQLTDTTYREVTVYGLGHYSLVYQGSYTSTTLADSLDPDNQNFIVPLHYGIAHQLPLKKRNLLFKDSLRLVFQSVELVKAKWYQAPWFTAFTTIVSIGIFVYSGPIMGDFLAGALAAATNGALALIQFLLPGIAITMGMRYAFKLLADVIGAELLSIIAVVVAVYAISQGNVGGINYFTGMTTSQMCMNASSAMLSASNAVIKQDLIDVQEEMSMFASESEIKWNALETAIDLLDSRSTLNPLALLATPARKTFLNESPSDFYDRTIHHGNVGVVALDMVTHYHDIMLRLPKAQYS